MMVYINVSNLSDSELLNPFILGSVGQMLDSVKQSASYLGEKVLSLPWKHVHQTLYIFSF